METSNRVVGARRRAGRTLHEACRDRQGEAGREGQYGDALDGVQQADPDVPAPQRRGDGRWEADGGVEVLHRIEHGGQSWKEGGWGPEEDPALGV